MNVTLKSNKPKYSIIIPVFNVQIYIERCIKSIIEQESTLYDIECIIVDDCSTDDSLEIVLNILNTYHGHIIFKIRKHEKNQGVSAARNSGFEEATGEYILFLDADDCLTRNSLLYFTKAISEVPQADLFIGNHFEEENQEKFHKNLKHLQILSDHHSIMEEAYCDKLGFFAWNKVVKRSFLEKYDIRFTTDLLYEDILWSIYVYQYANTLVQLPDITYDYKNNPESICHTSHKNYNKKLYSLSYISNELLDNVQKEHIRKCVILIYRFIVMAINLELNFCCEKKYIQELEQTKKRITLTVLRERFFMLTLFLITMYRPFIYIQKFKFFRNRYYRLSLFLYKFVY